jgi:cell division protein FtsQ
MDGQRRIAQSIRRSARSRAFANAQSYARSRTAGVLVRSGAFVFVGAAALMGLIDGGHLGSSEHQGRGFNDKLSAMLGFAAQSISISGLTDHKPEQLLKVLGVAPGSSLVGFDAEDAKGLLEGIDWVEHASVQRKFPNQLEITVKERQPFALWQRGPSHYVIDKHGVAMSGVPASRSAQLPLVSGEGANTAVAELYDELHKKPDLLIKVKGAARVGQRRWTLYLDNDVKILLPETGIEAAIDQVLAMDTNHGVLKKPVSEVDVRNATQFRVAVVQPPADSTVQTGSIKQP